MLSISYPELPRKNEVLKNIGKRYLQAEAEKKTIGNSWSDIDESVFGDILINKLNGRQYGQVEISRNLRAGEKRCQNRNWDFISQ